MEFLGNLLIDVLKIMTISWKKLITDLQISREEVEARRSSIPIPLSLDNYGGTNF